MNTENPQVPLNDGVARPIKEDYLLEKTRQYPRNPPTMGSHNFRLSPEAEENLVDLRWEIVELGPLAEEFDLVFLGYIEALLTVYGSGSEQVSL